MLEQIGSQFKILREIGPHKNKSHEGENCSPVTRIEALSPSPPDQCAPD